MTGRPLSETDEKLVWDWIYEELSFKPSVWAIDWPSIKTSKECLKLNIASFIENSDDPLLRSNFLQKAIDIFTSITITGEEIYALDWQHECYYYDPRQLTVAGMLDDGSDMTKVSFIPNGDYYIFITKDFQNVWFGHPWEQTVTLLGDKLIRAAKEKDLSAG